MPSSRRPTVPDSIMHRRIDGKHRRAFGDAIAFENAQAELLHPGLAGFRLHPLGAGHDEAHGVEIVRMGVARIAREECVGAEEDRRIGVIGHLGDDLVVERRGIEEGPHARRAPAAACRQ